jgi:tRNA-Thr(GGU) m(6)t(6)A37 methyltransferase TsaA
VWLDLRQEFAPGLLGIEPGAEVIVITWLHQAHRDVLEVRRRKNPANPLTGVFFTRSPDRPNPLGLHRVTVREVNGSQLRIGPMEAIDGTPVVDIKAVLDASDR